MLDVRNNAWKSTDERHTPNQTSAVLRACGVTIDSETDNDFLCFCLFHKNNYTPSLSVSRTKGTYVCFNPSCGAAGTLVELVMRLTNRNEFAALRLIMKKAGETDQAFRQDLEALMEVQPKFTEFPQATLDGLFNSFMQSERAQAYMLGRKFEMDTMMHFQIGYSGKKDMICVPMHDPNGMPIGLIGRSVEGKSFHNSVNLPKSKTLWNLHRAKAASDTVIILEASFDVMRVHQAGFPNATALLGGSLSRDQIHLLDKYFNKIIIMTDNDEKKFNESCAKCRKRGLNLCAGHRPGLDLGQSIAGTLHRKSVSWASHKYGETYPHGAKDPGEMTDEEIKTCIRNAVPHFEFNQWSL